LKSVFFLMSRRFANHLEMPAAIPKLLWWCNRNNQSRTAAQKAEILIPDNPEQHFRSLRLERRETTWKWSPGYRSAADAPNTHKDIKPQDSLNPFWCQMSFAREFLNRQKRVMIENAYEMMDELQGNKVRK
jgi:hypothetical protein